MTWVITAIGGLTIGGITAVESQRANRKALRQQKEDADRQFKLEEEQIRKEDARLSEQERELDQAGEKAREAALGEKRTRELRRGRSSTIIAGRTSMVNLNRLAESRKKTLGAGG